MASSSDTVSQTSDYVSIPRKKRKHHTMTAGSAASSASAFNNRSCMSYITTSTTSSSSPLSSDITTDTDDYLSDGEIPETDVGRDRWKPAPPSDDQSRMPSPAFETSSIPTQAVVSSSSTDESCASLPPSSSNNDNVIVQSNTASSLPIQPPKKKCRHLIKWLGHDAIRSIIGNVYDTNIDSLMRGCPELCIRADVAAGALSIYGPVDQVDMAEEMCKELAIEGLQLWRAKKRRRKSKSATSKSKTAPTVDVSANIPKYELHIEQARALSSGDHVNAIDEFTQALMLDLPRGFLPPDVIDEVVSFIKSCADTDDSAQVRTQAVCIDRCIYYMRQRRDDGFEDTVTLAEYHRIQCRILCKLMRYDDSPVDDVLHCYNLVNKSCEFIQDIVPGQGIASDWLDGMKKEFRVFKRLAHSFYMAEEDKFKYKMPSDEPCLKTLDAMNVNDDIIDTLRQVLHSDPSALGEVEQIQRDQMELANEARREGPVGLPESEFNRRFYELRTRLADVLHRLTGRIINLGYGLSQWYRVIYNLNYAPHTMMFYNCDLFDDSNNKIDPDGCCPGLLGKGIVTSLRGEAGGTDDDSSMDNSEYIAFLDRLIWVCNTNTEEYVDEIGPFVGQLQRGCTYDAYDILHSITPVNIMLIVTHLNVYHDVQPTIVVCGAPARDEGYNENVRQHRPTPECINGGAIVHPQTLMEKKWMKQISQENQARMTKTLLLANGALPHHVTIAFQSHVCEKWAGTHGMTPEDRAAMEQSVFERNSRGGKRCYELRTGCHSDEVRAWNSQRLLNLAARQEHPFQQSEVIDATRRRNQALIEAGTFALTSDENRAATRRRNRALIDANEHPLLESTKKKGRVYWQKMYDELVAYKQVKGHCNVNTKSTANPQLATWVRNQRYQYKLRKDGKKSQITDEQVEKLDELGFKWSLNVPWEETFDQLNAFKVEHGHCNVSEYDADYKKLGTWVNNQRAEYKLLKKGKKSSITDEQVAKLGELGFKWRLNVPWGETFEQLKAFKVEHGHCNVSEYDADYKKLGNWVTKQRTQYRFRNEGKKSQITDDRVTKLNELGFVWRT